MKLLPLQGIRFKIYQLIPDNNYSRMISLLETHRKSMDFTNRLLHVGNTDGWYKKKKERKKKSLNY